MVGLVGGLTLGVSGCFEESTKEYITSVPDGDWIGYVAYPFRDNGLLNLEKGVMLRFFNASKSEHPGFLWLGVQMSYFSSLSNFEMEEKNLPERDAYLLYDHVNKIIDKKVKLLDKSAPFGSPGSFQLVADSNFQVQQANMMRIMELLLEELPKASKNYLAIKKRIEENDVPEDLMDSWVQGIPEIGYEYLVARWEASSITVDEKVFKNCTKFIACEDLLPGGEPDPNSQGISWIYCDDAHTAFPIIEINKLEQISFIKYETIPSALSFKVRLLFKSGQGIAVK